MFLEYSNWMADRTDSRRLFQRDVAQKWKALVPVLVLTLETHRLSPLFDLSERDGVMGHTWCKDKQTVFQEEFCSQKTDLELNFNFYL